MVAGWLFSLSTKIVITISKKPMVEASRAYNTWLSSRVLRPSSTFRSRLRSLKNLLQSSGSIKGIAEILHNLSRPMIRLSSFFRSERIGTTMRIPKRANMVTSLSKKRIIYQHHQQNTLHWQMRLYSLRGNKCSKGINLAFKRIRWGFAILTSMGISFTYTLYLRTEMESTFYPLMIFRLISGILRITLSPITL